MKGCDPMHRITYCCYPGVKTKAVTLSYDDGTVHDRRMVEILNQYGVKCTFHICTSRLDTPGFLSSSELPRLYRGHEVALHTHTHPTTAMIPRERLIHEVMQNRRELEEIMGDIVTGMSYSNGSYSKEVIETMSNLGVRYARTTCSNGQFALPENFMEWHPTLHHSRGLQSWSPNLKHSHTVLRETAEKFVQYPSMEKMPILYVWGHSHEFEGNQTWDVIEDFCAYISEQKDIWFATNGEIYEYLTAMRALRFSADCSTVYNPTATAVCILADGKPITVQGGEKLHF